jgi:hypothetical protein
MLVIPSLGDSLVTLAVDSFLALHDDGAGSKISDDIFILLSCPYLGTRPGCAGGLVTPKTLTDEALPAAKQCLQRLMAWSVAAREPHVDDIGSLLAGVGRLQCWGEFLAAGESTYSLASALLLFVEKYDRRGMLTPKVSPAVHNILNAWLGLELSQKPIPPVEHLAKTFFGEAWLLFADLETSSGEKVMLGSLAYRERPLFTPGLCPTQGAVRDLHLPDMVIE